MHAAVLRYIDQVARYGSIRRAAGVLNVASSAVNRQILKLEDEMGVPLFERVGNGVRPTAAGDYLIRHARETIARWQSVQVEIASLSGDIHGEVRILSIPSPLVRLLPRSIERTAKVHPNVTFRVIDASPTDQLEEMRARRPDVAVLFVDQRRRGYHIAARIRSRLGTMMRPDHPLASRKEVTLTDCAAHPVIMLSDPWLLDATAETEFSQSGAQFRATLKTNSLSMTKDMLKAGVGIAFFTPTGFVEELKAGELVCVPLAEPDLSSSEIALLIHRERQSWPAVRALTSRLIEEFESLQRDLNEIEAMRG